VLLHTSKEKSAQKDMSKQLAKELQMVNKHQKMLNLRRHQVKCRYIFLCYLGKKESKGDSLVLGRMSRKMAQKASLAIF
jgi:hypothetical protein